MKKYLMIAFAMTMMPLLVSAQFSVSGEITDQSSNMVLAGASLSLGNTFISTQSNTSGDYIFNNLKKGTYIIRVSYVGYKTLEKKISVDQDLKLDIALEKSNLLADEVLVSATRAGKNSATTYRNMNKAELEKNNLGQDLPFLLNQTPSVVVTSDAGAGVGYTGIRIRGSDATRINVTINGIPYNDTESQGTYFVDLPDFASSVDNIQIQRGVGTSTNGAGAFGGSLNIQTTTRRDSAYVELNNTYGSYQTLKNIINAGTGLINNKFSFDSRLSRIQSDGYIDRSSSKLKSYFLSGAYYGKNSLLRANVFSGAEKTYQAWNGVPEDLLKTNRTFNSFTYDDQTDNYNQDHYQLLYTYSASPKISVNGALHYTHGKGYYEEYKDDQTLANYGIDPVIIGGQTISKSNLIRRRWLDNDFYGMTYSLNYAPKSNLNFTLGGAYNEYDGNHFGEVIWAQYASTSNIRQKYYDGNGFKTDFNVFGKANYQLGKLDLFADLQYRLIHYSISGTDKNRNLLDQKTQLNFFNPKLGLTYLINEHTNIYASFAIANKEPNRDDYVNSTPETRPLSENLKDIEVGYRTIAPKYSIGLNGFAMIYKNQLILTGRLNDVGEPIRQNVANSYRYGIELDGKIQITNEIKWAGAASLSQNKVNNFREYLYDYDNSTQVENQYKKTDIAFSPSFVGSSELSFIPLKNTEIALLSKYVSKQYLDNTYDNARKLNSYLINDLRLHHNFNIKTVKNVGITLLVNNVFNELYESNGAAYSDIEGGNIVNYNYYYPQATRNFLLSLSLKF